MLYDFIAANHDELLARTRAKVAARPWPSASSHELENGIPVFLTQVAETLRLEGGRAPFPDGSIGATASRHGRDLLARGYSVSQVVHDYGDVCQVVTELAIEHEARISPEEFHTLNRCLDTAIAEAVSEHARLQSESTSREEVERLGQLAHELRNLLQTALLSFQALKSGRVGISGSTGAGKRLLGEREPVAVGRHELQPGVVLGRSLIGLRDVVDAAIAEVRIAATQQRSDRISLRAFLDDLATAAHLHAEYRELRLAVEPVDPALEVLVDAQLLTSALMNLLQNAFKYTHAHGQVSLRTRGENGRVLIEVEDECGGREEGEGHGEASRPFGDRRRSDRSGLGLGLSITRKAVKALGGELRSHDLPGKGCVFAIDLPLAAPPG